MVRATLGILGAITMLFIGIVAVSTAAQQSESRAMNSTNGGAEAWNATTGIVEGVGQAAGPAVVYGGIAAIILIVCGLLVMASRSGGR